MSTTVDQRVVEMRFDNRQFESNVADTLSTVDKLKQKLNMTGAAKGLESVSAAAKGVNLSGLSTAVDTVHAKFSALQVMGITALSNITNTAVNAGKRIVSALTIEPIKTGFSEYETKINAIQTIMSNTASKGTTMEDVTKVIGELNTYADKTIYNFAEMTRNIGTFTAAGVGLEESATAIQGIANLAAVSGSTSQQASTAMYQLSQALASGTVKLMDWNSVVNAGMGGQVFQDALKDTARAHGVAVDSIIKKEGSFRESLSQGWLTADILTETLAKMTKSGAAEYLSKLTGIEQEQITAAQKLVAENKDGTATYEDLAEQLAATGKVTKEDALEILKLADNAEDAATKVKTFTQLWDTLKESAQSGWSQTWEILVGDFEEAKELFTKVSDVIGGMIGESANARNELLQGWKDAGGRMAAIMGIEYAFEGVMNVIKPIKEAFREIFPPITVKQLLKFTSAFKNLMGDFKNFTAANGDKIKSTFKGIFAAIDIGVTFVKELVGGIGRLLKNFKGLGGGLLDVTGSFGDWLINLRDTTKETDIFGKAVDKVVGFVQKVIDAVKNFGVKVKGAFDSIDMRSFILFFQSLWKIIRQIGSKIGEIFAPLANSIMSAFGGFDILNVANAGLTGGVLLGIKKFVDTLTDTMDGAGGILDNVKGILGDVRGCFEAYQNQLQAGTLLKIASAIGILALAILLVGSIDPGRMDQAVGGMTILFAELIGSLAIFNKLSTNMKSVTKAVAVMISMSVAVLILATAMKTISTLDWNGVAKGLVGVGALMAELAAFLAIAKIDGRIKKTAGGIVILSAAMLILAKAVEDFGAMEWSEIGKGLASIGALLLALGLFTKLTGNAKNMVGIGVGMVLLGASMKIFASAVKDFSGMNWLEIGRGLAAMAGALAAVTIAMKLMPKNLAMQGTGLVIVAAALKIIANAMSDFAGMSWAEIGRGLAAMGGALAELSIALMLMNGTLKGSAALIIAAGALAILAPVLKLLGTMTWEEIAKGLVGIAGAFVIVGVAGLLLGSLVPTILSLAASFALFGLAALGIGAGLALAGVGLGLISTGFTALCTAISAGATVLVAGLAVIVGGLIDMIPEIVVAIGTILHELCVVIAECAPEIANTILVVLVEVMASLVAYTPQLVTLLFDFVIGIIDALAEKIPDLIVSVMNLIGALFEGVIQALSSLDPSTLINGLLGIGLISALMVALAAMGALAPAAMVGVLGMGAVIAELAIVLAAVGALAQIPGLHWLIGEGGALMAQIGSAIGGLVGGIVGGVAEGMTASLPQIGTNLSDFMTNVQPFIDGAASIDPGMMAGVKALAGVILTLTAADILSGIASWISGGSSLGDFANEIVPFGKAMKDYGDSVAGIDATAVTASATAAKALVELANNLPNTGGLAGWFAGENDMSAFGTELVAFGESLTDYSDAVTGINAAAITASATASEGLVKLSNNLPNTGGLVGWFAGENDMGAFGTELVSFGRSLKKYSAAVTGLQTEPIANSAAAADYLVDLANTLPNTGGLVGWFAGENDMATFGSHLASFGRSLTTYSQSVADVDAGAINRSVSAARAIANVIGGLVGLDTSGVAGFTTALNSLANSNIEGFISAFGNATGRLQTAGSNLMASLLAGIRAKIPTLQTTSHDAAQTLTTSLEGEKPALYAKGIELISQVINGMLSGKTRIGSTGQSLALAAANGIRAKYSNCYSAGSYCASGLVHGLNAGKSRVRAAAEGLADEVVKGITLTLIIKSPSRRLHEYGEYAGEGFVGGLDEYGDAAYDSGANMAENAVTGLAKTIGGIWDAIPDNMNLNPTIRPILDLSAIQNGAGQLDGLFSRQTLALAGANASFSGMRLNSLDAAMARMQTINESGNAELIGAISSLRGDFGSLVEAISHLQLYMDSGAVVGELVGKMDTRLGQITMHKGRRN